MGHNLESPGTDDDPRWDDVYLYRGDEVVASRPVFTGDIFTNVEVWGETDLKSVIVVQHPCVIRYGVELAQKLLVAEVSPGQVMRPEKYIEGYLRQMPLGRLTPEAASPDWNARFDFHHIVTSEQLGKGTRIACLSQFGNNLLMQRWVHHNSRVVVPSWLYQDAMSAQYEEADIIEEWCNERSFDRVDIGPATKEIDDWLSAKLSKGTRRDLLKDVQKRSTVRRGATAYLKTVRDATAG